MTSSRSTWKRIVEHPWLGLVLIAACLLPLALLRASRASTFWGDEMYTIVVANLPVDELVEASMADAHPPTYYLAIKGWLRVLAAASIEPSILLARLPNLLPWLLLCAAAWFGGRRLLGTGGGSAFALLLGSSAHAAFVLGDLRHYSTLIFALTTCWLIVLVQYRTAREGRTDRRREGIVLWVLYAALAALALWTQLLGGVFLFLLGLAWIALCARLRSLRSPFVVGGAIANAAAVAAFLPWAGVVIRNLEFMASTGGKWMTPPTLRNLGAVFVYWMPFGQSGFAQWPADAPMMAWGALALAAPVGVWLATRSRTTPSDAPRAADGARIVAVTGFAIAVGSTLIMWGATRAGLIKIFHGPRYPAIGIGCWTGALAALATMGVPAFRKLAFAALVPFAAGSAFGWHFLVARQHWGAPSLLVATEASLLPPAGSTLYAAPEVLVPYWRSTYRDWNLVPLREIVDLPADQSSATVVELFGFMDRRRDGILCSAARNGAISAGHKTVPFPSYRRLMAIHALENIDRGALARFASMPGHRARRPTLDGAAGIAVPELQSVTDGWQLPEELSGTIAAWSSRPEVHLHFDAPLAPGRYSLVVEGGNPPMPEARTAFEFEFAGTSLPAATFGEGPFRYEADVTIADPADQPVLVVRRPVWRDESGKAKGFLLVQASLGKAD